MKKLLKIFVILLALGAIGAGLGYQFIYNKPHRDYEKAIADFRVTSQELYNGFLADRKGAEAKYNGKVVEISGILSKVETPDSLTIAVFALREGMFGDEGIRCTMLLNHSEAVASLVGKEARIKGFVAGYNDTDVILEKCSVIQ